MATPRCPLRSRGARPLLLCPRSRALRPMLHVNQHPSEVTTEYLLRAAVREGLGASGAEDAVTELRWQVRGSRLQASFTPCATLRDQQTCMCIYVSISFDADEQSEMQNLRGELEAESQRLPEVHRLSTSHIDQFMRNARRSKLTRPEEGLVEFRALCKRLGVTAKQVSSQPRSNLCRKSLIGRAVHI